MSDNSFTTTKEFLLSVIGGAPYGIIVCDMKGLVIMANLKAKQYLDISDDINSILESNIFTFLNSAPELSEAVENCLKTKEIFDIESIAYNDTYLSFTGRLIEDGLIISVIDVTGLKEMEVTALNSMLEGQELERKRIAKEIHDGLGPLLSTIKMHIAAIQTELGVSKEKINSWFDNVYQLIDTTTNEMRGISQALMPRVLEDFGLVEALDNLCKKIEASNQQKVEFFNNFEEGERLDISIELGIYRIGQELINNILKYACAKKINIQLIKHSESIILMVEDDGKGFDIDKLGNHDGIGLKNVETRANALGGLFSIDSMAGRGVTVTVEIPLENKLLVD